MQEKSRLEQIVKEVEKENQIVNSEIELMEDEVRRYKQENAEMKR